MAARNSREAKARRRFLKQWRAPLEAKIDLVEFLKVRQSMSTGTARALILCDVLRIDSHPIGYRREKGPDGNERKVLNTLVPAEWRDRIEIHPPRTD